MYTFLDYIDVSTRGERRKAMMLAVELLEKIRRAEERCMERTPLNLRSSVAYNEANYNVDALIGAIVGLWGALEPF
jgi:hypothetical protein